MQTYSNTVCIQTLHFTVKLNQVHVGEFLVFGRQLMYFDKSKDIPKTRENKEQH